MTDVADDGAILHLAHVVDRDHLDVAGGGDEDVALGAASSIVVDLVAFHRRLQGADRIDLGDHDPGRLAAQARGRTLADIAVAADDRDLAGHHHVGGALDAVDQALAAAVQVVELRLGDAVVDVDGGQLQLAALMHLIEAVDAGGGLLGDTLDRRRGFWRTSRVATAIRFLMAAIEDLFFLTGGLVEDVDVRLGTGAEVKEQGRISAIVEDHVRVPPSAHSKIL